MRTTCQRASRPRATRSNSGQGLALIALFLVTMVALVGLGVDGGSLYLHRRTMQNAADAAAFAGARLLSKSIRDTPTIRAEIEKYAGKNYVSNPASDVTAYYTDDTGAHVCPPCPFTSAPGTAPAGADGVEVIAARQAPTLFLPIVGYRNLKVSAIAAARGIPATAVPQDAAFALDTNSADQGLKLGGSGYVINGNIHSNDTIAFGGGSDTLNGIAEYVSGTPSPGSKWTLNPSTNNPVQSTVLTDPVSKTTSDFYQGTTSTATYHYINGDTNLSSFFHDGVFDPGVYYVVGKIKLSTAAMSTTQASTVTFVATGSIETPSTPMNFQPYSQGMLFFSDASSGEGVKITGNSGSWNGVVYAPHAYVELAGTGGDTLQGRGSLVGWNVITSGSGRLSFDGSYLAQPMPAQIILYK